MKALTTAKDGRLRDQATKEALRRVSLVATVFGEGVVRELLVLPNAELGKRLKLAIKVLTNSTPTASDEPTTRPSLARVGEGDDRGLRSLLERQALAARRQLVQEGELVTAEVVKTGLNLSAQALRRAVNAGRMFVVEVDASDYFPAFYLTTTAGRRKLEAVTKCLGDLSSGSKWQFFTQPKGSLGGLTPLQALELGLLSRVKEAAAGFAES